MVRISHLLHLQENYLGLYWDLFLKEQMLKTGVVEKLKGGSLYIAKPEAMYLLFQH